MEDVTMKRISRLLAVLLLTLFSSLAWCIDINTADATALAAAINGVGEKRAQAIVDYRDAHGQFQSVDDLMRVKGIGPVLLEKNRENLVASQPDE
jgi:competence protein ComEA